MIKNGTVQAYISDGIGFRPNPLYLLIEFLAKTGNEEAMRLKCEGMKTCELY